LEGQGKRFRSATTGLLVPGLALLLVNLVLQLNQDRLTVFSLLDVLGFAALAAIGSAFAWQFKGYRRIIVIGASLALGIPILWRVLSAITFVQVFQELHAIKAWNGILNIGLQMLPSLVVDLPVTLAGAVAFVALILWGAAPDRHRFSLFSLLACAVLICLLIVYSIAKAETSIRYGDAMNAMEWVRMTMGVLGDLLVYVAIWVALFRDFAGVEKPSRPDEAPEG
jgi:hypothetical protein